MYTFFLYIMMNAANLRCCVTIDFWCVYYFEPGEDVISRWIWYWIGGRSPFETDLCYTKLVEFYWHRKRATLTFFFFFSAIIPNVCNRVHCWWMPRIERIEFIYNWFKSWLRVICNCANGNWVYDVTFVSSEVLLNVYGATDSDSAQKIGQLFVMANFSLSDKDAFKNLHISNFNKIWINEY